MTGLRTLSTPARGAAALGLALAISAAIAAPAAAVDFGTSCRNPDDSYTVSVPRDWYYNERVEGGEVDDVAACRFFSSSDFEIRPATDATGIAISISREATAPRAEGSETTVGGKSATIIESVAGEDGFEPAGTRHYQYWIDMGDDWLVADTSDGPNYVGDYDTNTEVLDAMMGTVTFGTGTLPDTAMGSWGGGWLGLVLGVVLLALAFIAGRATSPK
jgi:hypothetical protein